MLHICTIGIALLHSSASRAPQLCTSLGPTATEHAAQQVPPQHELQLVHSQVQVQMHPEQQAQAQQAQVQPA